METTCDNYMAKINDIETACQNNTTTFTQIQTLINELTALDTQINTDLATMGLPTTMVHLNKLILVQIERSRKQNLQYNLFNLIVIRKRQVRSMYMGDPIELETYMNDTENIIAFVDTIMSSCNCMRHRMNCTEYINQKSQGVLGCY